MAAIAEALLHDAWAMAGISVAIICMFAIGELLRRGLGVEAEATRKFAHVGGGVVVLGFPWILSSAWTVAVLSASFFLILLLGRVTGVLGSVHAVDRRTSGAELYPAAVMGTWWLSGGEALAFCVPMAVMAAADAGAAFVGKRMGTVRFRVMDGARSLEGSLTFFAIAFAIFLAGLALDGRGGWPGVLLIALIGGVLTTCVEAISVRGIDNVLIPWAGWLVIDRTLRLGLAEMSSWVEGMLVAFIGVLVGWNAARLQPAAAVAAFVFGTVAYALGGLGWFLPIAALGLAIAVFHPRERDVDLEHVAPLALGSVGVLGALQLLGPRDAQAVPYLAALAASGAIALARLRVEPGEPGLRGGLGALPMPFRATIGALLPLLPAMLWPPFTVSPLKAWPVVIGAALVGALAWLPLRHFPRAGRRLVAAMVAGLVAWGAAQARWY